MAKRYINPLTDYGFKKIFGDNEVMREFLNDVISPTTPIDSVEFLDKEMQAACASERGVIYDLRCTTQDGREFIVEMQKCGQRFFYDRMLYYMSRSISEQGERGKRTAWSDDSAGDAARWDFRLHPVYGVFILDFHLEGLEPRPFRAMSIRVDDTGERVSDKLAMFTLELPDFNKMDETDCNKKTDYWSYMMTHLEHNEGRIPFEDIMPIFGKVATMAELSKMSSDERRRYEDSEDLYLSNLAAWDYNYEKGIDKGWNEGLAKGKAEEKVEIAKALKKQGLPVEMISACTGLPVEEVVKLMTN